MWLPISATDGRRDIIGTRQGVLGGGLVPAWWRLVPPGVAWCRLVALDAAWCRLMPLGGGLVALGGGLVVLGGGSVPLGAG